VCSRGRWVQLCVRISERLLSRARWGWGDMSGEKGCLAGSFDVIREAWLLVKI
jgi:hypothetical protein